MKKIREYEDRGIKAGYDLIRRYPPSDEADIFLCACVSNVIAGVLATYEGDGAKSDAFLELTFKHIRRVLKKMSGIEMSFAFVRKDKPGKEPIRRRRTP